MGEKLSIYEVGLRDGLQNEATRVATNDKAQILAGLVASGLTRIEATSFVSPTAVPQMADASDVMAATRRHDGVRASALVINEKGYDRALAAGAHEVAIVVVISETLAAKNSRMTVAESLDACQAILRRAARDNVFRRVYLAPAWVCPYEGAIAEADVLRAAEAVLAMGLDELAIADTIGHANPHEVGTLFRALGRRFGTERLAAHLHDTQALALANAVAAIDAGVRTLDASIGGLGGCPFAPGAAGNLATEDLVFLATKLGFDTGVSLDGLWHVVGDASRLVGRTLGGRTRAFRERSAGQKTAVPSLGGSHVRV